MPWFHRRKHRVRVDPRLAELGDFLHAASHDETLAAWLRRLPRLQDAERANEVHRVAMNMKRNGEPAEVITALSLLASEPLARAAADSIE